MIDDPHPFDRPESQPLHLANAEKAVAELRKIAVNGDTIFTTELADICVKAVRVKRDVERGIIPDFFDVNALAIWLEARP